MNKIVVLLLLSLCIFSIRATVWNVNNNAGTTADFSSLSDAINDLTVVSGDTLYVYGSPVSYGTPPELTKRLTIIGPGYFLNQNTGLQTNLTPASVENLTFDPGSEGSLVSGMTIHYCEVSAANVVIQRNNVYRVFVYAPNCMVLQNFFNNIPNNTYTLFAENAQNLTVGNNLMWYSVGGWCIHMTDNCSGTFYNNCTWGSCRYRNAEVYNCIVGYNSYGWTWTWDVTNSSVHHNVLLNVGSWDWHDWVSGDTNIYNVTDQVYLQTGSDDSYYQLCTGSPALGAGLDGADCGIFGGPTPYKLSGIPAIPTIYNFHAPATGFTIPVEIGARSNN